MFKFKLQKLLDYRNQLEEQAKAALGKVMQELLHEQKNAQDLENLIKDANLKLQNIDIDKLNERILFENYLRGLYQDHNICMKRIQYWQAEVDKAKATLLEKSIEKKTIEKLKENQAAKYAKEELQLELKVNDEISSQRFQVPNF